MKNNSYLFTVIFLLLSNILFAQGFENDCDISVLIIEGKSVEFKEDGGILHATSNKTETIFEWYNDNGTLLSKKDILKVEKSGIYHIYAYLSKNCEARASIEVKVEDIKGAVTIMEGMQVEFTYQGQLTAVTDNPLLKLEWRKNNLKIGDGKMITVRETGVYTVYLITPAGRILQTATSNVIIKERLHTVVAGDNLERIARKYYGDGTKADLIEKANPKISGTGVLEVGSKLIIPNEGITTAISKDSGILRIAGNSNFPPFCQIDAYKDGMSSEIVRAVFNEMNMPIEIVFMDANKAKAATFNGSVLGTYPYIKNNSVEENLLFSNSLYSIMNVFFVGKQSTIVYEKPKDLKGKTVAILRGYEIGQLQESYDKGIINIRPCRTLDECFQLLSNGTVDLVLTSEMVGWMTIQNIPSVKSGDFKTLGASVEQNSIHLVISKNSPMGEQVIKQFNEALERLATRGVISEIENRHIDKIQRENRM